ncbi:dna polymerase subunit gamma-1 [Holotrichia oblita]|uniref:Dna polymerase subunit gamma-1 n=1 Tax=Holotrichia oblita TaxID=644536 RepID=A0ACB9T953_HOLOL|nr:dna polymerase subunit gamma-1 [Holotrichia oblita]
MFLRKKQLLLETSFKKEDIHAKPTKEGKREKGNYCPWSRSYKNNQAKQSGYSNAIAPIYEQVFKNYKCNLYDNNLVQKYKQELEKHGIKHNSDIVQDVDFIIPPLEGENLEEHFANIAENQCKPYKNILDLLLLRIPPKPEYWVLEPGWTRYAPNSKPEKVDYPLENGVIFDVEVCMSAGQAPTLATAVSINAWYGWVSPSVIVGTSGNLLQVSNILKML